MSPFDPYLNWLGIPAHEQPPNFYRLLGVVLFESTPTVIEQAADRQSLTVGAYQGGPQAELCQRVLSEIAMARYNLLDPQQKASYDAYLQEQLAHRGERAVAAPPPPTIAGRMPSAPPQPQYGPPPSYAPQPMPQPLPSQPVYQPQNVQPPLARPFPVAQQVMPAPFPIARAVNNGAAPAAPPAIPPAAPQRPMDELESLAAQSAARRRITKKKRKADYSKEIMFGGVAAAAGIVLVIIYIAAQGPKTPGLGGVGDNAGNSSNVSAPKPVIEKPKPEKEKTPAAVATVKPKAPAPRMPIDSPSAPRKTPIASDDSDVPGKVPTANAAPRQPNRKDIDSPQQLGGADDPVMGKPGD
jgi:hypothetical protein